MSKKRILRLNLKTIYFEQIRNGRKTEEYREVSSFWEKRLEDREYDEIHILKGYPKSGDMSRTIKRKWNGCAKKVIQHEHFGHRPIKVYAIDVTIPLPVEPEPIEAVEQLSLF